MKPTISLVMIVCDVSKTLDRCLQGFSQCVDEIVVVIDTKTKDNSEEMSRLVKDMTSYTYCNTNILDNLDKVNFASDMDRFVFQNLPLTNSQKEQLLLSMFTKV